MPHYDVSTIFQFNVGAIRPSGTAAIFLSPSPKKPRMTSISPMASSETKLINIKLENEQGKINVLNET